MTKHILVVDDSKTIRNLLTFVMKKERFEVTTAQDGIDGLEKLFSVQHVDLILTDINMPHMDGLTFIKHVREQDKYNKVPIIILSTEGDESDIKLGLSYGADMYMVKPAPPKEIIANVRMLLS